MWLPPLNLQAPGRQLGGLVPTITSGTGPHPSSVQGLMPVRHGAALAVPGSGLAGPGLGSGAVLPLRRLPGAGGPSGPMPLEGIRAAGFLDKRHYPVSCRMRTHTGMHTQRSGARAAAPARYSRVRQGAGAELLA